MAQKMLGRQRGERGHTGGHRRWHGRPQGGAFGGGGHEGGYGKLALVRQGHDRTGGGEGREADDGRPVRRIGRRHERTAARRTRVVGSFPDGRSALMLMNI